MARRVFATAFARQLSGSAAPRRSISRYVHVLMAQQSEPAACLRVDHIGLLGVGLQFEAVTHEASVCRRTGVRHGP